VSSSVINGATATAGSAAGRVRRWIEGSGQQPTRAQNMSSGIMMAFHPDTRIEIAGGTMWSEWMSRSTPKRILKQQLLALWEETGAGLQRTFPSNQKISFLLLHFTSSFTAAHHAVAAASATEVVTEMTRTGTGEQTVSRFQLLWRSTGSQCT
jgi:hypothetical protein